MHSHLHQSADHQLDDSIARLKHVIRANYWFRDGDGVPDDVYHEVLYDKGRRAMCRCRGNHWMPFFSPLGYGYRFDAMANGLATLLDVADEAQCEAVDDHIADHILHDEVMLLPAFDPVITPKDEDWDELQMTFSHTFKNAPHEYHNGGLCPIVTGSTPRAWRTVASWSVLASIVTAFMLQTGCRRMGGSGTFRRTCTDSSTLLEERVPWDGTPQWPSWRSNSSVASDYLIGGSRAGREAREHKYG
jgi:hypothetical protein